MKFITFILAVVFALGFAGTANADSCADVEREMAFGEAAAEDAKDAAGFKLAAEQFKNAVAKAPECAAAFYNLGIVQEKAGELAQAKYAFERYLKLAPKARDAAVVEKKIFKLEYRIVQAQKGQQEAAAKRQRDEALARRLAGRWANPAITLDQPYRIGHCSFQTMQRGYLSDFRVSGTKVEGTVVGTPFMNTSSCKAYFARENVPYLRGTVEGDRLIGEKYNVMYGGSDSGRTHGAAMKFEWKINMAADGRSFTVDPIRDDTIKSGDWTSQFSRY